MASILEPPSRLIECPADLADCCTLSYDGRQLLYFVIGRERTETFIVVLGFFSGQINDVVTKDLIAPIPDGEKSEIGTRLRSLLPGVKAPRLMFL
jgi:hypothetical protein